MGKESHREKCFMPKHITEEFQRFDRAMEQLVRVPHSEVKKKLEEEKAAKAEKKRKKKKTGGWPIKAKSPDCPPGFQ